MNWNFNAATLTNNPGTDRFSINNANKYMATELYVHRQGLQGVARFDEFIAGLRMGSFIFIRERNTTLNDQNELYEITGSVTLSGEVYTIPVTHRRGRGTTNITADIDCDFHFFRQSAICSSFYAF